MTDYVFVWEDAPPAREQLHGLEPVVRAANGETFTNGAGFDYQQLYAAWERAYGPVPAWTYFYPGQDGRKVATALLGAAPAAPLYVIDVEDPGIEAAQLQAAVEQLAAHAPVWLSTWGTVAQADARKIPYRLDHLAGIWPQVYYETQLDGLAQWAKIGPAVWPTFAPADWADWHQHIPAAPCSIWRYGAADLEAAAASLATNRPTLPQEDDMPLSDADLAKISDLIDARLDAYQIHQNDALWRMLNHRSGNGSMGEFWDGAITAFGNQAAAGDLGRITDWLTAAAREALSATQSPETPPAGTKG